MKRRKDPEDNELLSVQHMHIDDKGKEEAIEPLEDMLVDSPVVDEVSGSKQPLSFQDLPYDIFSIISTYLPNKWRSAPSVTACEAKVQREVKRREIS